MTLPQTRWTVAIALPAVLAAAWWLPLLPGFGDLQYADYYDVVARVADGPGWSSDPLVWLGVTSNEHHVPLPALLYLANWAVADGDNRGLSAVTLLAFAACVAILALLAGRSRPHASPLTAAAFGMLAAATLVGPAASHHVVMGYSGAIWVVTDAFALAAIAWTASGRPVWIAMVLAAAASTGYSTALGLWPALVAVSLAAGRSRRASLALGVATAVVVLLFAATYQRPVHHAAIAVPPPWALAAFVLRFLGSPVTGDRLGATLAGAVLLTASAALAVRVLVGREGGLRRALAPWWGIQLYALANAALAALSRAGDYVDHALSARYLPLGVLFLLGLGGAALTVAPSLSSPRRRAVASWVLAAAGVTAVVAAGSRGQPFLRFLLDQAERHPAAAWALRQGVWDADLVETSFCGWPEIVPPVLPVLRGTGHVPFDLPPDPELGRVLEAGSGTPANGVRGTLDLVQPPRDGWARVAGWAWAGDLTVDEVVLVDRSGVIRGKAYTGFGRGDVAAAVDPEARLAGFVGFARAEPGTPLRAFARVEGMPLPVRLEREREVPPPAAEGPPG